MDKAKLLASRLPTEDVDVPGVGKVRIRALSRAEALAGISGDGTPGSFERALLAVALVDPELTPDEVGQWQKASHPDEIEAVVRRVNALSGIGKEAAKAAYKEFEADPDAEFRSLPGGEAEHDGGPDAGGDE